MSNPKLPIFPPQEELLKMRPKKLQALVTKITGLPLNGTTKNRDALSFGRRTPLTQRVSPEDQIAIGVRSTAGQILPEHGIFDQTILDDIERDPSQPEIRKVPQSSEFCFDCPDSVLSAKMVIEERLIRLPRNEVKKLFPKKRR